MSGMPTRLLVARCREDDFYMYAGTYAGNKDWNYGQEYVCTDILNKLQAAAEKTVEALENYSSGDCYLDGCAEELKKALKESKL